MYQQILNTPDCEPALIGLVTKPHDGVFYFIVMETKKCTKCLTVKNVTEFYRRKNYKNGICSICKKCWYFLNKQYLKTKNGLACDIYNHQKFAAKQRNHVLPDYTVKELRKWMFAQTDFEKLFNNWVKSGYNKWLKPSCDRLDDYKSYSFDNLRLVTWKENLLKESSDMKNGINNKQSKAVVGTHKITGKTIEFYSIAEAARQLKLSSGNISNCCRGKIKYIGDYIWKYV